MNHTLVTLTFCALSSVACAQKVNCPNVPNGKPSQCIRVSCSAKYQQFLGVWKGQFRSYVQERSAPDKPVYRPYENTVSYAAEDCLKNSDNGDTFILGRMTDTYPAFSGLPARTEHSSIITGTHADGSPYLQTIDENKAPYTYQLDYQNAAASLSVWKLSLPAHGQSPEMKFTVIDGRDYTDPEHDRRNVTITLRVGPKSQPYFDGVIESGYHIRLPELPTDLKHGTSQSHP